jgi:hypothetical protein
MTFPDQIRWRSSHRLNRSLANLPVFGTTLDNWFRIADNHVLRKFHFSLLQMPIFPELDHMCYIIRWRVADFLKFSHSQKLDFSLVWLGYRLSFKSLLSPLSSRIFISRPNLAMRRSQSQSERCEFWLNLSLLRWSRNDQRKCTSVFNWMILIPPISSKNSFPSSFVSLLSRPYFTLSWSPPYTIIRNKWLILKLFIFGWKKWSQHSDIWEQPWLSHRIWDSVRKLNRLWSWSGDNGKWCGSTVTPWPSEPQVLKDFVAPMLVLLGIMIPPCNGGSSGTKTDREAVIHVRTTLTAVHRFSVTITSLKNNTEFCIFKSPDNIQNFKLSTPLKEFKETLIYWISILQKTQ